MIVVLILSSILIVSIGSAYYFLVKQNNALSKKNNQNECLMLLENQIRKDFMNSSLIKAKNNTITCFSNDISITYFLSENKIIREQCSRKDTFWIFLTEQHYSFIQTDNNSQLLNTLELRINNSDKPINLCFIKKYHPETYFNK